MHEVRLSICRELSLEAKRTLYSACVVWMFYGSETWSVKEDDVIKLERNEARMVRWMCSNGPDIRILFWNFGINYN